MLPREYEYACTEVLRYLKGIKQEDINKIPRKFIEFLKENANKEDKCDFDYTKPLKELKLSPKSISIIDMIYLNYWATSEEEKMYFKKVLKDNEIKYQQQIRKI